MPKKLTELQKRGYLLPATINPAGRVYVCVPIPDDPNHIRAFLGQLDMLSYWWTWDRDTDKQGTLAAQVWRGVVESVRAFIDEAQSCDMSFDLRINDGCTIQKSTDGGATWEDLIDLSTCTVPGPAGSDGTDGIDGSDGADGREIELRTSGGYIQWRYVGDVGWTNLVSLTSITGPAGQNGQDGQDGTNGTNGEGLSDQDTVTVPPPTQSASDALRCGVAYTVAKFLRTTWAKQYDQPFLDGAASVAGGAAATISLITLLIPGVNVIFAVVSTLGALLLAAWQRIDAGEVNNFDDDAEARIRNYIYCTIGNDGAISASNRTTITGMIRSDTHFVAGYGGYIADFVDALPIDVIRQIAYAASPVASPSELCESCGDIALTYNPFTFTGNGPSSGPATCSSGDIITITSDGGSNYQGGNIKFIDFSVSDCVHAEIISITGATLFHQSGNNIPKFWRSCPSNAVQDALSIAGGGTLITVGENHDILGWSINSATVFSIEVRLTKL